MTDWSVIVNTSLKLLISRRRYCRITLDTVIAGTATCPPQLEKRRRKAKAIHLTTERKNGWLRPARIDRTQHRVLAAHCARGLQVIFATSRKKKVQGMPDARCTRGLVCHGSQDCAHEHTGQRRQSDIPCAMALRLISALPGDRLFCHRRSSRSLLLENLTPAPGRQDHTTSPYASVPFVKSTSASTATRPTFATMANAPLSRTGWLLM